MSLAARTMRNTVLVTGARLASRVLTLVVIQLIARAVTVADNGRFGLLVVTSSLVSVVMDIGLRPLYVREAAKDRSRLSPYLNSILSLKLVMTLPAFAVLFLAVKVQPHSGELLAALLPTLVMMIGASFANQTRAVFYASGELHYEAVTTIGETLVLFALTVIGALSHQAMPFFLWAYAASWWFTVAFSCVVAVTRLGHRFAFDLDMARLSMLARESFPFALSFVITTLYYKVDQPIMQPLGVTAVGLGLYVAAYKFVDAATFLPQALMDPVYPALSRVWHETPDRLAQVTAKAYKALATASLPVASTLIVLAGPIIRYGPGQKYLGPGVNAASVLQVLGLSVFFLFVNNTFIYTLNAMGRQSESTRLAVLSLVVNLALNVVLIPQSSPLYGGFMGAAWATAMTELALFIGGYLLLRRYLFRLPLVTTLRGVLPSGVLCAAAMAGVATLLPDRLWGAILALAAGGLVYCGALLALRAFSPEEIALVREGLTSRTRR